MALIKWGDEEENKEEELFQTPRTTINSVQSGWQPTQDETLTGGAQPQNESYLLSDQKAQIDAQQRQQRAAEEAARAQAAQEQAEAARRAQAAQEAQIVEEVQPEPQQTFTPRPKYGGGQKKNEGGVTGFLKDVGAGIQQGFGTLGDIAIQGGGTLGMIGRNDAQVARQLDSVNKVRGWLHGQKDINGNNLVGTRDVEQSALKINNGTATTRDWMALGGKSLQAGIDATMFANPIRMALPRRMPTVSSSDLLTRAVSSPAIRYAARDAAFYGGAQGLATGATQYGATGDVEESLKAAGMDALVGGALQGTLDLGGHVVGKGARKGWESLVPVANKSINSLRPTRQAPVADAVPELPTPAPQVADGFVQPAQVPTQDGNLNFESNVQTNAPIQPVVPDTPPIAPIADNLTPVVNDVPQISPTQPVENPVDNVDNLNADAPAPAVPAPVADGTVLPSQAVPAATPNMPVIKGEEIRKLQDARAGATQAEEAEINQQLQETKADIPAIEAEISSLQQQNMGIDNALDPRSKANSARIEELKAQIAPTPTPAPSIDRLKQLGLIDENGAAKVGAMNQKTGQWARLTPEQLQTMVDETGNIRKFSEDDPLHITRIAGLENPKLNQTKTETTIDEMAASSPALRDALPKNVAPVKEDSLPKMEAPSDGKLTRKQVAARLMPKLASTDDMKNRIATAVRMDKDTESPLADILRDGNVNPRRAEKISKLFSDLEQQLKDYNAPQAKNQEAYAKGGTEALDRDVSRARSRVQRDMGATQRRLVKEIDKLEGSYDKKVAIVNNMADLIGTRNANILTSAGLLERNITQELTANAKLFIKNPVKMAGSAFNNGNIIGDTAKGELSRWKDTPSANPIDAFKYVIGNTYRTAMIPTTTLANTRRGMYRDELTKWAYKTLEGRNVSSKEAHRLAGTAGNEMEALVNTLTGVDNGMTNRADAMEALKAWKQYIKSGTDGDKNKFLERVEMHSNLADQMIAGLSKDDNTKGRALKALGNAIFPFVRTATNLMRTTASQDLNPRAKSLVDEIQSDLRSTPANAALILKSKLVDYGIMSGAAALAGAGVLVYNDGDEVDKPRGWAIDIGDNKFVPVRATAFELPMALAGTAQQIANDVAAGTPKDKAYYIGMVTGSLPYIETFNQTTGAVDSLINGEDAGYAAKSYGINMAKSFVPATNNGVQAYTAGKEGKSLNAKTVYDKDMGTWFNNAVQSAWSPEFRNGLKDSRDNAGRTRTVDNQGAITNKTINDANSETHNDTIDELVKYGRENGLGKATKDMFNTYDTGQNNNFKSVQDSITFLDANGKPDPTKKLENNPKLANLAAQIRDGFYGETGSELLMLDGQNLKSDASTPNTAGTKNSKLPISMQSIKNAIAQTDLKKEDSDTLFAISGKSSELYNQLKSKSISYEQYRAAKTELGKQEIGILSNSPNYLKMVGLMNTLTDNGFFNEGGLGSTKSGQTYLWNSLNALLGSKGATPAAVYPEGGSGSGRGFTPWGRRGGGSGAGFNATYKPGDTGTEGIKWTPVTKRQMAAVTSGKYTPVNIKVKLGNAVKKDKTRNYSDRSF